MSDYVHLVSKPFSSGQLPNIKVFAKPTKTCRIKGRRKKNFILLSMQQEEIIFLAGKKLGKKCPGQMENSLRDLENGDTCRKFFAQFLPQITQLHMKQPQKIDTCSYLKNISIF